MKISVIIPVYNEEKHITACLDSLSNQTYRDSEVLVVDDGSTDHTLQLIKQHKTTYPLTILHQEHCGPGSARNQAAKKAKGDILVFIDADMLVDENYLAALTKPIVEGKTIGTFTKNEVVKNQTNRWAMCWNYEYIHEKSTSRISSNQPTTSKVYRAILASEFKRVGGYDEVGYGEDWTLSKKLRVEATLASGANVCHTNPGNAVEVFNQAKWFATRDYKLGEWGRFIGLVRATLPISIIFALIGSLKYQDPFYVVFKLIYDGGICLGILKFWLTGKYAQ